MVKVGPLVDTATFADIATFRTDNFPKVHHASTLLLSYPTYVTKSTYKVDQPNTKGIIPYIHYSILGLDNYYKWMDNGVEKENDMDEIKQELLVSNKVLFIARSDSHSMLVYINLFTGEMFYVNLSSLTKIEYSKEDDFNQDYDYAFNVKRRLADGWLNSMHGYTFERIV